MMSKVFMLAKQVISASAAYALAQAASAAAAVAQAAANAAQATATTAHNNAATAQATANTVGLLLAQYFGLTGNVLSTPYKFKEAIGWRDNMQSLTMGRATGANVPNWATIVNGIDGWQFSPTTMNELWINFHIDHDYKVGTALHFHVHWAPSTTNTGTVRWGVEFMAAKGHSRQAFPIPTTIYIEQAASGTALMHQVAEHAAGVLSASFEPDCVIMCRIFRDATHPNDTYTGQAWGIFGDIHYQTERNSTPQKAPNFYTGDS